MPHGVSLANEARDDLEQVERTNRSASRLPGMILVFGCVGEWMNGDSYVSQRSWGTTKVIVKNGPALLVRKSHAIPLTNVTTHVKVGYYDEPDGLSGFSRLVENSGSPFREAFRAALVAADSTFAGDDEAFWVPYSTGAYAPDLRKWDSN